MNKTKQTKTSHESAENNINIHI